jgi:hypothetical protein
MNEQRVVVRGIRGEEIEVGGLFCNWSVAQRNSKQTYFDLVNKPRTSVQGCRGRARGRASAGSGPTWTGFGPILFTSFLFIFPPELKQL